MTLGKSFLQFSAMKMAHAPPGHHSVVGRPSVGGLSFPEYVVYRGEQAYPEYLVSYQIGLPSQRYDSESTLAFADAYLERLGTVPGIESAALTSGLPLSVVSDEVAEKTAQQWNLFIPKLANRHLEEIREILDREDPSYKD